MNIGFIILQSAFRFASATTAATTAAFAYVACGMYIILKRRSFTFVQQQSNSRERAVKTLLRRKKKSIKRFLTAAIKKISLKKILLSKKK